MDNAIEEYTKRLLDIRAVPATDDDNDGKEHKKLMLPYEIGIQQLANLN